MSYWRLSAFYGAYYLVLGAFSPYFGPFLSSRGFSAFDLSLIMSAWYAARVISPPLWSRGARFSARPIGWLRAGAILSVMAFVLYAFDLPLIGMVAIMVVFAGAYNAILPQFEAITLTTLGRQKALYGRIRVWGSVGFVCANLIFGLLLDQTGYSTLILAMIPGLLLLAASTWINDYPSVTASTHDAAAAGPPLVQPVGGSVRRFLAAAVLMQVAHGAFYVFFSVYLTQNGYDASWIGILWAVGVLAEILMFVYLPRLLPAIGAHRLMLGCFAAGAIRWVVTAFLPEYPMALVLAQFTHALTFAAFHGTCIHLISDYYPRQRSAHGQAVLFGLSSGLGGIGGAMLAGALWINASPSASFLGSALASVVGFWILLGERRRHRGT